MHQAAHDTRAGTFQGNAAQGQPGAGDGNRQGRHINVDIAQFEDVLDTPLPPRDKRKRCVILVSICGGDIGEVTQTPHFCKIKSTKVPDCTQCTMEVTRYTAKAKFKSTSELLIT